MPKIIVICENHLSPTARNIVLENLDYFKTIGYDSFGFEHDFDKSLDDEISALAAELKLQAEVFNKLESLGQLQQLLEKNLQCKVQYAKFFSNQKLLALFHKVKALGMSYCGLDVAIGDRYDELSGERAKYYSNQFALRDPQIASQLLTMKNGIAIIGFDHMRGVQANLIEKIGLEKVREQFAFVVPLPTEEAVPDGYSRFAFRQLLRENKIEQCKKQYCPAGKVSIIDETPKSFLEVVKKANGMPHQIQVLQRHSASPWLRNCALGTTAAVCSLVVAAIISKNI